MVRIDVDRPYGKEPPFRHVLSRVSSDSYLPKMEIFGYLSELRILLSWLNQRGARAYVFFRQCTFPSEATKRLIDQGGHEIGLHLENSRSYETFMAEKKRLETHIGRSVSSLSKHGSGGGRFGLCHHPPYQPESYIEWAARSRMKLFLGNLEDPRIPRMTSANGLTVFRSAFWAEPSWRDTRAFPVEWLLSEARHRDVVLLVHPENILESPTLANDFLRIIDALDTRIYNNGN